MFSSACCPPVPGFGGELRQPLGAASKLALVTFTMIGIYFFVASLGTAALSWGYEGFSKCLYRSNEFGYHAVVTKSNTRQSTPLRAIKRQLEKPSQLAITFAGLGIGLVSIFVLPEWTVRGQWLATLIVISLYCICLIHAALIDVTSENNAVTAERDDALTSRIQVTPKVISSMKDPEQGTVILLLESHPLFGQSMLVSLYHETEEKFERLAAAGRVSSITTRGHIQIEVTAWQAGFDHIQTELLAGNQASLSSLLVRPAPTSDAGTEIISNAEMSRLLLHLFERNNQNDRSI